MAYNYETMIPTPTKMCLCFFFQGNIKIFFSCSIFLQLLLNWLCNPVLQKLTPICSNFKLVWGRAFYKRQSLTHKETFRDIILKILVSIESQKSEHNMYVYNTITPL